MNRQFCTHFLITGLILLLFSCRDSDLKRMPDTLPDIRGTIENLSRPEEGKKDATATILVKATDGTKMQATEASITVTKDVLIEDKAGKKLTPDALLQGQEVEVWFGNKTMESMPVQTDAIAIRILKQK